MRRTVTGMAGTGVALVLLAGCGGGRGPVPESPRSAVEGLQGRICRYVASHEHVPAFSSLTRMGAAGNIGLWGRDLTEADSVELSVRYDDAGELQWVEAIAATIDAERVTALEQLLLGAVQERNQADWGVRILVVGGDVVAVEPSVICDAEHTGSTSIWESSPNAIRQYFRGRSSRVPVRVSLDHEGRVVGVQLVRSSYNRWVDQYIIDYVRNSRFDPKLHDGIGVATTFELRLRFRRGP